MSEVLARSALAESPLADLHLLANELGVDGFRRLRKAELIDAILERQGGAPAVPARAEPTETADTPDAEPVLEVREVDPSVEPVEPDVPAADQGAPTLSIEEVEPAAPTREDDDEESGRVRRSRRGGRSRARGRAGGAGADPDGDEDSALRPPAAEAEERTVEGVVELLPNGSGFVRLGSDGDASDGDVYVSAAQVKRCEIVAGDRVTGPVRSPRRSERFPSLVRVDTINGRPADEVAEAPRFDDQRAIFPTERLPLGAEDPTVKAIEWLTPFGKGSRVLITGPARAGKSEALRRLAGALAGQEGLEVSLVLTGVRPEEISEWAEGPVPPAAAEIFAASPDTQAHAAEQAVEAARRVATRGGDAVVLLDTLEYLPAAVARRITGAARNLADAGSLTVIATAPAPLGGETTVIALDVAQTAARRFPALDLAASGTVHPERLVGDAGAEAITRARVEAI